MRLVFALLPLCCLVVQTGCYEDKRYIFCDPSPCAESPDGGVAAGESSPDELPNESAGVNQPE